MKDIALYIHIPFCVRKCRYCDFLSFKLSEDEKEKYLSALLKEFSFYRDCGYTVKTVFIGGGTPSLLPPFDFLKIGDAVSNTFNTDISEFTVECNPESLTEDKLKCFKDSGVNRISVGVQSLSDNLLMSLGRAHDAKTALKAIESAKKYFLNVNADLMTGLPEEKDEDGINTIKELLKFELPHISLYSLIVEEGTPLKKDIDSGMVKLPDEDEAVDRFDNLVKLLEDNGLMRYEVSNFAREGYECKHNLTYWTMGEYLGLGLNSHSYLGRTRQANYKDLKKYIDSVNNGLKPIEEENQISLKETEFEYIMLRLRLTKGIDLADFISRFNADFTLKYQKVLQELDRCLDFRDGFTAVKKSYFNVLNSVIVKFLD
jgi:oxygen-independent coproporphyrinogen-3 oxidase